MLNGEEEKTVSRISTELHVVQLHSLLTGLELCNVNGKTGERVERNSWWSLVKNLLFPPPRDLTLSTFLTMKVSEGLL